MSRQSPRHSDNPHQPATPLPRVVEDSSLHRPQHNPYSSRAYRTAPGACPHRLTHRLRLRRTEGPSRGSSGESSAAEVAPRVGLSPSRPQLRVPGTLNCDSETRAPTPAAMSPPAHRAPIPASSAANTGTSPRAVTLQLPEVHLRQHLSNHKRLALSRHARCSSTLTEDKQILHRTLIENVHCLEAPSNQTNPVDLLREVSQPGVSAIP